ncbi:glycoside hydrolase family 2 protein [Cohnella sp.]|uniref:glycoside hydrolase family 2 protein n=1 Tax=Cohnella sp. TaxID=1883426 RepID=UPI0035633AC5
MIRLFQTNEVRKVEDLEGMWDFCVDNHENSDRGENFSLPVPGCWETHPKLNKYRGVGEYRRTIVLSESANLRFVFKGISHTTQIYFDGIKIAEHYNAYTAFTAIVRKAEAGSHELIVKVDNSFHQDSSLHIPNDYYTYGGIIRPVALEHIADTFIERIQFTPFQVEGQWHADIQVVIDNLSDYAQQVRLEGELCGVKLQFETIEVGPGRSTIATEHHFPNAEEWALENPRLYLLKVKLFEPGKNEPVDDLIERVGFRTITTHDARIQLNDRDIVLKGFNRHEDHPAVGAAFPLSLMAHDLELIIASGSNCVRTSHYPNDERFLDLCDEKGIVVWEENHARGLSLEQMQHPLFAQQCEDVNREMVEQHANHPSIIIWGVLNECASDTLEGRAHYERQLKQIRAMDASRPLTFATHHRDKELCLDLADIVSYNLYPGWYTDEDPGELCDQARAWADAAGGAGKPMILSEFGGDGYYGHRDATRVRGTEERQADIIDANLSAYISKSYLSGMLIWQFCDCRVAESTGWLLSRAGTQNSKGIVDRYRRPKLAYAVVQKHFL